MSQSKPPRLPVVSPMPRCPVSSPIEMVIASPRDGFAVQLNSSGERCTEFSFPVVY